MAEGDTGVDENDPGNFTLVADLHELMENECLKEIGTQAVWSVSSCKQGYGVNFLRDNNLETFWQSDGSQPHMVNIQFKQKTTLHSIGVYTDYKSDESYTPNRLSIRIGNDFNDLHELERESFRYNKAVGNWYEKKRKVADRAMEFNNEQLVEISEPSGWIWIKLQDNTKSKPVRTFMTQISVLQNHQNGRDTHLRQIKVFTPWKDSASFEKILSGTRLPRYTSVEAAMYATIR